MKRYGVYRLAYFERHGDIREAIAREKRLKRWRRDWKIQLIETDNLHWSDLLPSLMELRSRIAPAARPG
jgi:putative endonuclease